jgi:hypothetical protein
MELLTRNAKIDKSMLLNPEYLSRIVQLYPGKGICFNKGLWKECFSTCLVFTGNGKRYPAINKARIKRSLFFKNDLKGFLNQLEREMIKLEKQALKKGKKLAIRLNGFSDIDYSLKKYFIKGKVIYDLFPDIQFWDYSKNLEKVLNNPYSNLHLTYSYNGLNHSECLKAYKNGFNFTVIDIPENRDKWFYKLPAYSGDLTDFRFLDSKGIIWLSFKK